MCALKINPVLSPRHAHTSTNINTLTKTLTASFSPDVHFDDDDGVMPLMSAAKIWSKLEDTVADDSVFKNITILLLAQVIVQHLRVVFFFLLLVIGTPAGSDLRLYRRVS